MRSGNDMTDKKTNISKLNLACVAAQAVYKRQMIKKPSEYMLKRLSKVQWILDGQVKLM